MAHNFHLGEPKCVVTTTKQLDAVLEALSLIQNESKVATIILADAEDEREIVPTRSLPSGCKLLPWTVVLPRGGNDDEQLGEVLLDGAKESFSQHDLAVLPFSSGTTGLAKGVSTFSVP